MTTLHLITHVHTEYVSTHMAKYRRIDILQYTEHRIRHSRAKQAPRSVRLILEVGGSDTLPGCNGNNPQGEAAGSKVEGPRRSSLQVRGLGVLRYQD